MSASLVRCHGAVTSTLKLGVGLVIALAALFGQGGAAHAVGDLDQSVTGTSPSSTGIQSTQSVGQIFTAGRSGLLDRVTLELRKTGSTGAITVSVFNVVNNLPSGTALATQQIAAASVGTSWAVVTVDFAAPATVAAGTQYAIFLEAPTTSYTYSMMAPPTGGFYDWASENNPLATGYSVFRVNSSWSSSAGDMRFATYVTAPTPPAQNSPQQGNTQPISSEPALLSLAQTGSTETRGIATVLVLLTAGFIFVTLRLRARRL